MTTLPDIPWLVGGDFNMVESQQDKSRGNPFIWKDNEKIHWNKLINSKTLFDPLAGNKASNPGIWHTRCNFQQGHSRIYSRLDRFYSNKNVFSFLPDNQNNIVLVTTTTLSDHHPIFTRISLNFTPVHPRMTNPKFILNTSLLLDEDILAAI